MNMFYRKKGKYADGRDRIVIEDREKGISKTLPKPEELIVYLGVPKYTENEASKVSTSNKGGTA